MNRFAAALICLAALPLAALADPPGRVARLSLIEGEAAIFADPEQGWEGARVNSHLTSENSVWTEPGARAEVAFGSTALRLGEATQFDILLLDDEALRAHVPRGTLTVRIRHFGPRDSYLVSTPQARFQLRSNGRYRIDADPERGESRLTVFTGTARLETAGGYISVDTSRSVRVTGGDRPSYQFEAAYSTGLDEWALARDQHFERREAARYVPPEMTGWEDLDDYGDWRYEAEYGAVWFPTRIEAGWAPYRYGRWTWVRPWGWAWVDDAPWGYAPFHYGRWVSIGNRWGWYPGRYTSRPVWAPALVGWVGQPGWSISISTGLANVVGWYPLSPYDNYQPWYAANVTYVTNVNRIVMRPRHDRDRRDDRHRFDNRDRGATVVPREHFGTRRPVQQVQAQITREIVRAQPVVPGATVLPSRSEWRSRTRPAIATPPAGVRAPSTQSRSAPRPGSPLGPAQGRPVAKPVPAPAAPAAPVSRFSRPGASESAPRTAPTPAQVQKPMAPQVQQRTAPQVQQWNAPQVQQRTAPQVQQREAPQVQQRTAPQVQQRTAPQVQQRTAPQVQQRTAPQVQQRTVPQGHPSAPQPRPNAFARPAPAQSPPAAKPAPAPRAVEKPGRPAEKVEKPDTHSGG